MSFIDAHRGAYGVEPICRVLPIAPSTYFEHKVRATNAGRFSPPGKRDATLREDIRRVWEENFDIYGIRKVWRQLGREGARLARCTVERLMRQMGLQGAIRGREFKRAICDNSADRLVRHSDRDRQYVSIRYTERLAEAVQSKSRDSSQRGQSHVAQSPENARRFTMTMLLLCHSN
jgi:putative transposase